MPLALLLMIQFYSPDIVSTLTLPESDSGHCTRVLRMGIGDSIVIVDGKGHRFNCRITEAHHKHTRVCIDSCEGLPPVWSNKITVAVAPTKNMDRMEWLVEKLVEIGVNRIVPLRCRYSERREIKVERLEKIAVSAMKQSLKAVLPTIDEMTHIGEFLASVDDAQRFIGYCSDSVERRLLSRSYKAGLDTTLLIGPEGDFSPEEVELSLNCGFIPVTMGDNRLRTETAALAACHTCHIINQLYE